MVRANVGCPLPEQDGCLPKEDTQGRVSSRPLRSILTSCPDPVIELLPGIRRGTGCTEGGQIYPLEVHPREPREAQHIPSVSTYKFHLFEFLADRSLSLTQATDTGKIKLVFAAIKETILSNSLKEAGVL